MLPPIQFTGHGIEITPTLRQYISEKFAHLDKFVERIFSIHVILVVDKLRQIAEAKLHIPNNEIYAKAESEDMYKTIDILMDKLNRQLDKYKGKHEDKRRRG